MDGIIAGHRQEVADEVSTTAALPLIGSNVAGFETPPTVEAKDEGWTPQRLGQSYKLAAQLGFEGEIRI